MVSLLVELEMLGWTARGALLDGDVLGVCDWEQRIVWIDERLDYECMRSTLMHEIQHIRRGPNPGEVTEECTCEAAAAAELIPLPLLALATRYAQDEYEVAIVLAVDVELVRARVAAMTPDDVAELLRHRRDQDQLLAAGIGLHRELLFGIP